LKYKQEFLQTMFGQKEGLCHPKHGFPLSYLVPTDCPLCYNAQLLLVHIYPLIPNSIMVWLVHGSKGFHITYANKIMHFSKANHLENWKEYLYHILPISSSWIIHQLNSIGTILPITVATPPSYIVSLIDNNFLTLNLNHCGGVRLSFPSKINKASTMWATGR
jgi:hypothetical protein